MSSVSLVTQVRVLIDERVQGTNGVQDQDILYWFNAALEQAAEAEAFEANPTDLALVAGTSNYAAPADFVSPRALVLGGKALTKASLESILVAGKDPAATGTPTHFYVLNNKIYAWPVPVAAANAKLYYFRTPVFFAIDGSGAITPVTPDLPRTAWQALVKCALTHYLTQQAEGDISAAGATETAYQKDIAALVRAIRKSRRGQAVRFRSSIEDERRW